MADPSSGDRSAGRTNGAVRGQRERVAPAADAPDDPQTLADAEQTLADSDQTLADADQTGADRDQASADCEQVAADSDQAASDQDLSPGADRLAHEFSRGVRQRAARQREQTALDRLDVARRRDDGATSRDLVAAIRDQAAEARDIAMSQLEAAEVQEAGQRAVTGADVLIRAAAQRTRAAQHRAVAAEHRASAAKDREAARQDREQAARERLQARADREALAGQLALAETDVLTGVRTRAAGLIDLDHEIERCRRTAGRLVACYIDVVGLKALNDSEGHGAGDELLQRVVRTVREHVRSYDLIVRLGGDEFLCAMSNVSVEDARVRFGYVAGSLALSPGAGAIRTGFAQLTADESATDLIARADGELLDRRQ